MGQSLSITTCCRFQGCLSWTCTQSSHPGKIAFCARKGDPVGGRENGLHGGDALGRKRPDKRFQAVSRPKAGLSLSSDKCGSP